MVVFCDKENATRLLPHAGLTSIHTKQGYMVLRVGEWLGQIAGQPLPRGGAELAPEDVMRKELDVTALMKLAEKRYIAQNLPADGGSSIVQVYRQVKAGYGYEDYLTNIKNSRLRVLLSNFRVGNHKLQNQLARWQNLQTMML